jgi:hypothetical protein
LLKRKVPAASFVTVLRRSNPQKRARWLDVKSKGMKEAETAGTKKRFGVVRENIAYKGERLAIDN